MIYKVWIIFYFKLVRLVGLEPTWLTPTDFKSVVYTDSTTIAKKWSE